MSAQSKSSTLQDRPMEGLASHVTLKTVLRSLTPVGTQWPEGALVFFLPPFGGDTMAMMEALFLFLLFTLFTFLMELFI